MASKRLEITAPLVAAAVQEAAAGVDGTKDYVDTSQPGLVLRIRRRSISWLVKNRSTTRTLGAPPKMGVREARREAIVALAKKPMPELKVPEVEPEQKPSDDGWKWPQLRDAYIQHISGARIKRDKVKGPSKNTIDDVKRALNRPQFDEWAEILVRDLTAKIVTTTLRKIEDEVSYPQYRKALAYSKAALSYGYSQHAHESGLGDVNPWWSGLKIREPSGEAVERIRERQRSTSKGDLTVEHIGDVLARHEEYCRGREGRDRISPAVRWGLWWEALTVARSGAGVRLLRDNIIWDDRHVPEDWCLVWWPYEAMKTPRDFYLPIPPIGARLLKACMNEWRECVNRSHGHANQTQWAFSSTRRVGRDHWNADPCMAPSALNCHLENMRGKGQSGGRNWLKGIPDFSPHSLRGVASTYIMNRPNIAPGAASAILAHALPGDNDPQLEKISKTTEAFYSQAQRIPLKIEAMTAWSEALLAAFEKAGGRSPFWKLS